MTSAISTPTSAPLSAPLSSLPATSGSAVAPNPATITFSRQNTFTTDPDDPKASRLIEGTAALFGIEEFMRSKLGIASNHDIPPNSIQSVQGTFRNENGKFDDVYSPTNRPTMQTKPFDLQTTDGKPVLRDPKNPNSNTKAFCFEIEWKIQLTGQPEARLRQTVYTNVEIPEINDPVVYERAKERAKDVAINYMYTIQSAADPNNPDHPTVKPLLIMLRTHHSLSITYKGEGKKDFEEKKYLNATCNKTDFSDVTITIGDPTKPKECHSVHLKLHKHARWRRARVATAPHTGLAQMRQFEMLHKKIQEANLNTFNLQKELTEAGITAETYVTYLTDKLREDQLRFEDLYAELIPKKPSFSQRSKWGFGDSELESVIKIQSSGSPPSKELQERIDKLKDLYNQLEQLQTSIQKNYDISQTFVNKKLVSDVKLSYFITRDLRRNIEKLAFHQLPERKAQSFTLLLKQPF